MEEAGEKVQAGFQKGEGKKIQEAMLKINLEGMIGKAQEEVQIRSHMEENQILEEVQIKEQVILEILVEKKDRSN